MRLSDDRRGSDRFYPGPAIRDLWARSVLDNDHHAADHLPDPIDYPPLWGHNNDDPLGRHFSAAVADFWIMTDPGSPWECPIGHPPAEGSVASGAINIIIGNSWSLPFADLPAGGSADHAVLINGDDH